MSQNPNRPDYHPYGPEPSSPGYTPGYSGQPPFGPNSDYEQPTTPGDTPSRPGYGPPSPYPAYPVNLLAPPPPDTGPYDPTVFSSSGQNYQPYTFSPSNPGYSQPGAPGYGQPLISSQSLGMPGAPTPTPPRKSNARTLLITVIALLIVVGGVLGIVLYNSHQAAVHNSDATATANTIVQNNANATGTAQVVARTTANAQATVTYTQTHYPFSSNLVLNDPLQNDSQASKWGWDVGNGCAFNDGAYEVTTRDNHTIWPCFAEKTIFSNFTFEIQMEIKTGGDSALGGVIFRANSSTDALYILFINTQGNYELARRANANGSSAAVISRGTINNFPTGFFQLHTIGVVANGSQITVYIDNVQIAQKNDPTYTSGVIGVLSGYGTSTTTVSYTNARVWQI